MAEVVEINDLAHLQTYEAAWNDLFQNTPRASFFHTYEWFVSYWKHFGQGRRMRVLVVRTGSETIGIMPLCVIEEHHRFSEIRVLTYPLSDWGMWYGSLGPNPSTTMFMAMQHIRSTKRDWDLIDLRWTTVDSTESDATGRAMSAVGWKPTRSLYQQTSLIRIEDTNWENYQSGLSKKWRHEIRRQDRNLQRQGNVEYVRHRPASAREGDGNPNWELFRECVQVSRQSWQAFSQDGNTICHPDVLGFLEDCHAIAARLGMLDMAVLRVGGQPLAFQYNYHHQGEIFGLRMGYAKQAREMGVGKVLLARFIEDGFLRGDRVIDLGIGEFDFKSRFRTDVEQSYRYSYAPWTAWRSQGVRLSQWLRERFRAGEKPSTTKHALAS